MTLAPGIDVTCLKYDANTFKSQVNSALLTTIGLDGTLTIFRDSYHQMLTDQLCSEEYITGKVGANTYEIWKMKKPQVADNDLWDALVGTAVIASFCGIESASATVPVPVKQKTKLSDIQKQKR